ncbi:MAG TPA: 30S ribosomal protein S27ae [Candidatus Bathyarchaeia archaeon]|nr:30S ribosomal protein S27ae [Candidatus Bathyarchaeia archaeon]
MSQPATPQQKQAAKEPQKPKAKKHRMRGDLYDLSGAVAKLKNRKCPRCGSVMAFHGGNAQRWVCGSCSFTDYGQK